MRKWSGSKCSRLLYAKVYVGIFVNMCRIMPHPGRDSLFAVVLGKLSFVMSRRRLALDLLAREEEGSLI